jgi:hypothetical protein
MPTPPAATVPSRWPKTERCAESGSRTIYTQQQFRGFPVSGSSPDWVADNCKPPDLAEAALAHVNGDKTMTAYQRSDLFERRRALMAEWAAFVAGPAIKLAA